VTELLFRDDAYLRECEATVVSASDGAVVLDRTVFYARGGGQPGDTGKIAWDSGAVEVADTLYGPDGEIRHVVGGDASLPAPGTAVRAIIDWERRYRHMRMHTGLHLLGVVLPHGVTGGNISEDKSRLDFDMEDTVDKDEVTQALRELVAADHPVKSRWITDEELEAQPDLVRTMSVKPPSGAGHIRLLEIPGVDLQPCGGTHVRSTAEIGSLAVIKVEKKGRHNRRVYVQLED
jgi:misacylated tRNA(Ala) deacylase